MAHGEHKRRKVQKFTIRTKRHPDGETQYGYELIKVKKDESHPGNLDGGYLITKKSRIGEAKDDALQPVSAVFVRGNPDNAEHTSEEMQQLIIAVNHRPKGAVCWPRPSTSDPVVAIDGRHRFYAFPKTDTKADPPVLPVRLEAVPNTGFVMNTDKPWRAWVYEDVEGVLLWNERTNVFVEDTSDPTKRSIKIEGDTWVAAYFVERPAGPRDGAARPAEGV